MDKRILTTERIQYFKRCPLCKQEIKGFSESQVDYNLDVHTRQKHNEIKQSIDKDIAKRKFAKNKEGVK